MGYSTDMNMKQLKELEQKWRKGASITNGKLTKEGRKIAAKKGWDLRKQRLAK